MFWLTGSEQLIRVSRGLAWRENVCSCGALCELVRRITKRNSSNSNGHTHAASPLVFPLRRGQGSSPSRSHSTSRDAMVYGHLSVPPQPGVELSDFPREPRPRDVDGVCMKFVCVFPISFPGSRCRVVTPAHSSTKRNVYEERRR